MTSFNAKMIIIHVRRNYSKVVIIKWTKQHLDPQFRRVDTILHSRRKKYAGLSGRRGGDNRYLRWFSDISPKMLERKHRNVTVSRTQDSLLPNNSRKCGELYSGWRSLLLDAPGRRDVDRKRTIIDRTL